MESGNGTGAVAYKNKPVKTIYDPCPPGFVVPQTAAFDGFGNNNGRLEFQAVADFHTPNEHSNFELYTSQEKTEYISFPACGYRNTYDLTTVTSVGYYWSAVLLDSNGGGNFRIDEDRVCLKGGSYIFGFSVRPIAE